MLTKLRVRNFKGLKDTGEIPLDSAVVFIGPNNSGKTTALQALSLWYIGINKWIEKRSSKSQAKVRTAVPINRKDLFAIPTPHSRYLWNDLFVRESARDEQGKVRGTENVKIEIMVEGISAGKPWKCPLEFDYDNEEVIYCRPSSGITPPEFLKEVRIAYLPPMSGLVSVEPKLLTSTVSFRIGEGRTAEVLRNLCYQILMPENGSNGNNSVTQWEFVVRTMLGLFGISLNKPVLNERGEIEITYKDQHGNVLDLSSAGRGLQQVLLLTTYLLSNPNAVLLLDEPDAHLEILRQRQIYNLLTSLARERGSQVIAASHSEVVLKEAAEKDIVIAFLGKPHQINDKGSQLMKSLETIGFEDYYQAEQKQWVLYLEGSTDLSILQSLARKLDHPAKQSLEGAFVKYVSNNIPNIARDHFRGLREAVNNLIGVALFDRVDKQLNQNELYEMMWQRYEIENYIFRPEVLLKYVEGKIESDLFAAAEQEKRLKAMNNAIESIVPKIAMQDPNDEYWRNQKASEQLERVFAEYFKSVGLPNMMYKNKLFELADLMSKEQIDKEVIQVLDKIHQTASARQ